MGIEHASIVVAYMLVASIGVVWVYVHHSTVKRYIRRIAGVDAIHYAVSRAVELGRPISFSTGLTGVGPVLYAGLGVLKEVAKKVAAFKAKLIVPQNTPEALAMVEDTVREAYISSGRLEHFDPKSIVFLSEDQFAFASGYMGLIHRENVGSAFLFGQFSAESLILAEAGQQVGAFQIGASISPEQVPFFICTCDYTLIGEELFAAATYLSDDAVQAGVLAGQDRIKLAIMAIILLGVLIVTIQAIYPEAPLPSIQDFIMQGGE